MKKISKKVKKRKNRFVFIIVLLFIFSFVGSFLLFFFNDFHSVLPVRPVTMYLASHVNEGSLYQLEESEEDGSRLVESKKIARGCSVKVYHDDVTFDNSIYKKIKLGDEEYYINEVDLVKDKNGVVLEDTIYVRSATVILEDVSTRKIVGFAKKGSSLKVLSYDKLDNEGNVYYYKVQSEDVTGYVYGKYMSYTLEEANLNYEASVYDAIHGKVPNTYDGGEAIKLDFYPNDKPVFSNNKMPDAVYALYLGCGTNVIQNIDAYIEFARATQINAFVVDIKDNETPAYPASVFEKMSPTNYNHAINSYEDYKNAITKLKEAGFYVIGRITTFKDSYYVTDHPEDAILDNTTGKPYLHNGSYWPSAYNRNVWYYTLSLALEAVSEFGFHEINFDYVRFPDRMNSVKNRLDLKNVYDEDKVEAIQRFVQYVTDGLHEVETYVSIDVFGESTNSGYTTAYGQYWPGISNIADVISGMPYPDHFSAWSYGIRDPWNHPYELMKYWAGYAMERQKECPTPAKVRTWIQAYDVMKYVDSNGITYNASAIEKEIRGLYDAGAMDGYITWLSSANLDKYKSQKAAFQIDYRKEYYHAENNG